MQLIVHISKPLLKLLGSLTNSVVRSYQGLCRLLRAGRGSSTSSNSATSSQPPSSPTLFRWPSQKEKGTSDSDSSTT